MSLICERRHVHYRIVFKELGKSLREIHDLHDAFEALIDALMALKLLHKYKFVHRGIGAGNILLIEKRGVLADLDSAQSLSPNSLLKDPVGTYPFMAMEVSVRSYFFILHKMQSWQIAH
ncbi:hypothetical protein HETIRDRAFT_416281 [Heterobasidion irregulare TC 32-1]|uniref:Protein kinase domain-containing protein n=1 Tax=Heterobasidion irregulare (strain TC 32-1) TaxID=747525 RepID=W4KFG0_HETIT|nr:uncharacterized protein HETIRDRAFT_416281 [Heterobasidion irregulare TC 32-1]ETW84597.1 hypothetical protein HETIRDRAFT_416281 [Heterobasidion irregulare TC 32-1]